MHRKRALAESRNCVQETLVFVKNISKIVHYSFRVKAVQALRNFGADGRVCIFNCGDKFLWNSTGDCLINTFL